MLEFLGFIALLAIIFGVSFGAALVGFAKFVVIGLGVIFALGIIFKMLESKKGARFVVVASLAAVVFGVYMINDPLYSDRINSCDPLLDNMSLHATCMVNAMDDHNAFANRGWGYAICGTIAGLFGLAALGEKSGPAKTHSVL